MDPQEVKKEICEVLTDLRSSKYLAKENRVSTAKEYFALPLSKRTRNHWLWGKMYLLPDGLIMNPLEIDGDLPLCSEWDVFYRYIKRDYPIQYFFRVTVTDFFDTRWRRLKDCYYELRDRLSPRQRWLLRGVPNHWCDKRSLSVDVLYNMIIHFIEEEDALNTINWESDPEHLKFKQGLVECYKWIKIGRPELIKQMDTELVVGVKNRRHLYKTMGHSVDTYHAVYGPYDQLEAQIEDTDTTMCIWIITNRAFLWT